MELRGEREEFVENGALRGEGVKELGKMMKGGDDGGAKVGKGEIWSVEVRVGK